MNRQDIPASLKMAMDQHARGQLAEALASYDAFITLHPEMAPAHSNRGAVLASLGRHDEALGSFDTAIRLQQDLAPAYFYRGNLLRLMGLLDRALADYDAAILHKPDYTNAHFKRANILRDRRQFDEALAGYKAAVSIDPDFSDVYNNMGGVLSGMGHRVEALLNFEKAIKAKPNSASALRNRATILMELERFPESAAAFELAIAHDPRNAALECDCGSLFLHLGNGQGALAHFDCAIAIDPACWQAHDGRGDALRALNRPAEALSSYDVCLQCAPQFGKGHVSRGYVLLELEQPEEALLSFDRALHPSLTPSLQAKLWNGRGMASLRLGKFDDAVSLFCFAIEANPLSAEAHNNCGNAYRHLKKLPEALCQYERAIGLMPGFGLAHYNMGAVLQDRHRLHDALLAYEKAIELMPDFAPAHNGRGSVLKELKRVEEAISSFDDAIARDAKFNDAYFNKGLCALLLARDEGWPLFEWRKKSSNPVLFRTYPQPEWFGAQDIAGKTLLIEAEQGLGDTIQFCRYARIVRQRGAQVVLSVQSRLKELIGTLDPSIRVVGNESTPPAFDYHAAMLSLPLLLRTGFREFGGNVPYLHAPVDRIASWKSRIGDRGMRMGISWQGDIAGKIDEGRSFPLHHFASVSKIKGVRVISLQKNAGTEQLSALPAHFEVESLGENFDEGSDAFLDAAAVMESLDLVITSDTAVAHLAGALGRPVWVALKYVPDWRWGLEGSRSPWYPSMTLFRQPSEGDWASVFDRMAESLKTLPDLADSP